MAKEMKAKLSSHFSHQRKWLDKHFKELALYADKTAFVGFFGDYAEFYRVGLNEYDGKSNQTIPLITAAQDADLASLLLLFLKESYLFLKV